MHIRDRIREFRRVRAAELRPNPRNWRTHPPAQRDALQGILAEVGYAGALLARELPDGSLELIDGHLRAETTPEMAVPVLVLDVNEEEAAKILATHDPLAGMAGVDAEAVASLLEDVKFASAAVEEMLTAISPSREVADADDAPLREAAIPRLFQVIVECRDEAEQQSVYERLVADDFKCRLLTL
ncbi:MAG TPA: ParB N-terminal domain-containing protein [Pirellulales bacterium]|nr:ParB N-terminal domain-containing protein [Pirellulales bacterium]